MTIEETGAAESPVADAMNIKTTEAPPAPVENEAPAAPTDEQAEAPVEETTAEDTEAEENTEEEGTEEESEVSEVDQVRAEMEELKTSHKNDIERREGHFRQHIAQANQLNQNLSNRINQFVSMGEQSLKGIEFELQNNLQRQAQLAQEGKADPNLNESIQAAQQELAQLEAFLNDVKQSNGVSQGWTPNDEQRVLNALNTAQIGGGAEFGDLASPEGKNAAVAKITDVFMTKGGVSPDTMVSIYKMADPNLMTVLIRASRALSGDEQAAETPAKKTLPKKPAKGNGATQPTNTKSQKGTLLTNITNPREKLKVEAARKIEANKLYADDPKRWNEYVLKGE